MFIVHSKKYKVMIFLQNSSTRNNNKSSNNNNNNHIQFICKGLRALKVTASILQTAWTKSQYSAVHLPKVCVCVCVCERERERVHAVSLSKFCQLNRPFL